MPRRPPPPSQPRWLPWLAWLSVGLAVVVCFGVWLLTGGDLTMWLTVGRWTWEHGWPPLVDSWSYTTAGAPFVAHSWLAGLVFYLVEISTGSFGFMVLRFALISVALTATLQTVRLVHAPWPALMLLAPLVLG
jgi:hypothetical protein